ncbi:hypothetical protein SCHPADRAFT_943116 [Schizopora paradoxa]|uniref:Uncharacterized protein n=1 Tax=Schizopora paradoxa TaxID=27342 RepID=A0A0H2RKT9_9AGAM|nr:hypothetical protein SCHPADRAFT_943116 [Schizopora paradoxa]
MTIAFEMHTLTLHGGDPSVFEAFGHQSRVSRGIGATAFIMTILLADCLIVWRCWLVWERCWWVCIVPVMSTIAGTTLGIISIVGQVSVSENRTAGVIPEHFIKMSTPCFILSMVTSLYSTVFIALRVILVQRETNTHMLDIGKKCRPSYSRAIEVLVESVALNTINLIAFVVFTLQKSERLDWPQDLQPQVAGIATTLLLLRVALGHARPEAEWSTPTLRSVVFTSYSTTNISGLGRGDVLHPQAPSMEAKKDSRRGTLASSWSDMSTLDDVC